MLTLLTVVTLLASVTPAARAASTGDPDAVRQWHLETVQVPLAWRRSTGAGAVVAVIDSGITPGPDLACRRFVAEYDATTGQRRTVADVSGHGTHVAGTIAQCSGNGLRGAGVAPDATLMDVRALRGAPGSGGEADADDVADAIVHASTNGADVINLSIAIPCPAANPTWAQGCRFASIDAAIATAVANDVLVVAAAGNDGSPRVGYPATHPDVLAVGAVDASLQVPAHASTGTALDVVAPGGIGVDTDRDGVLDAVYQETVDPRSGAHSTRGLFGSSHAGAHVSGVAALLRAAAPAASADEVRAAITDTACDLHQPGVDARTGHGLVRAADALAALLDGVGRGVCFLDVEPDSVFFRPVSQLAQRGITFGCNQLRNRFCPQDSVTRGQMAAFLDRALDLPPASRDWFRDDDRSIFEASIDRLREARITLGCNPPARDRFCPDQRVTRAQMAAFLDRALDLPPASRDWFRDDDRSIFEASIDRLREARITLGCNPPARDRFCPDQRVTRAQMAAFLVRARR